MFSVYPMTYTLSNVFPSKLKSKPQYTGNKPKMQKDTKDIYC